jgi:hypothetical protein
MNGLDAVPVLCAAGAVAKIMLLFAWQNGMRLRIDHWTLP